MLIKFLDNFFLGLEGDKQSKKPEKSLNGIKEIPLSDDKPKRKKARHITKKKNAEKAQVKNTTVTVGTVSRSSLFGFEQLGSTIKGITYKLKGSIGVFLGEFDRNCFSIVLRGDKGAGKSRLLFQIINAFANIDYKIAFLSLEMAKGSIVTQKYKEEYINPENLNKIYISDVALTYDEVNRICKDYDVVAIDSWTKLKGLSQDDFDRLQKENPTTIIVSIFQSTTGKVTRGGNMPEFDASIVIHVHEGGIAECEKNRFAATDYQYSVFDKKLLLEEVALND